jgi:hypothetical protein
MAYSIVKTNAKWSKEFNSRQYPNSEAQDSGSGTYEIDNQLEKIFDIEARHEEIDGVVFVKKSFEVDFGYSLSPRSSDEIKIPAKLICVEQSHR